MIRNRNAFMQSPKKHQWNQDLANIYPTKLHDFNKNETALKRSISVNSGRKSLQKSLQPFGISEQVSIWYARNQRNLTLATTTENLVANGMANDVNDCAKTIGARLRLTREAFGLSQADWYRLAGIWPSAWNNYETGLRRISLDQALKVCDATGVSLDWIYRGATTGLPRGMASKMDGLRLKNHIANLPNDWIRPRSSTG